MIGAPLNREELAGLAEAVGGVAQLLSRRSPQYRKYREALASDEDPRWLDLMVEEPRLVRRPIWQPASGAPWLVGFDAEQWKAAWPS